MRLVSSSAQVTRGIGEALGRVVSGPLAFLLIGDYGTGKTTFVQGIAAGLGIEGPVRSPSYNIMKRYSDGRLVLVHVDLYRTRSAPEIKELGLHDVMSANGILAVEWPGRYLPPAREMPSVTVHFYFRPVVPGQDASEDTFRNLEINTTDNCPEAVRGVLSALAAR